MNPLSLPIWQIIKSCIISYESADILLYRNLTKNSNPDG